MRTDLIIYTPMYVSAFWAVTLIFTSGRKKLSKQILAVFMMLAFLLYFSHALYFQKQVLVYLIFDPLYMFCSLSVYPMFYWYIRTLTIDYSINYRQLWLFLPALLLSLSSTIVYLFMPAGDRTGYLHSFIFKNGPEVHSTPLIVAQKVIYVLSRIVFLIQIFVFVYLGRNLVLKYNQRIENFYASYEQKTIRWVNLLLYSFLVTSLMSGVFNLIGRSVFLNSQWLLLIPSAIFSILIFAIGLQGHLQNYSVVDLVTDEEETPEITIREYHQGQLKERLSDLFEQKEIFRQSDLTINQVATLLQTNRTYVSTLINSEFGYTFSEFVNNYRVAAARKMLADARQQNYSLNYVSDACGFGSVNSFIRIFRQKEGTTPGKFRDKIFLEERKASGQAKTKKGTDSTDSLS